MMYVNVTPAQFAYIQDAMLRAEISRDQADIDHVIGSLCLCALDNGGEFNPNVARTIETKLIVIPEWKKVKAANEEVRLAKEEKGA